MTRTIGLSDEAYHELAAMKRHGESFSDVTRRLVAEHRTRRDISQSAGTWPMSDGEYDELMRLVYETRDQSGQGRSYP